ncbi:DUF222 domain-containing protein [Plantactinospora sp. B24E8]|uniref:HNH endonuclease signature motif containing protein n=1 Tax=Plantactinospora sp. B24E8 TaxID=3153567 RepID=UPI00325C87A8
MIERVMVPENLAELPPGPELGLLLATIDRAKLNGHDAVTMLQARARQVAYDQAQLLADLVEVAHCPPGDADAPAARVEQVDEFAADEIRMALRLTRRAAEHTLHLAADLLRRLPQVHAALAAGDIDLPRARVLSEGTLALHEETARRLVSQVLETAAGLTPHQLAARLRALVIASDPEAARRRQARSIRHRRLVSETDSEGTATLAGYQLPVERAAIAAARVDALARAAKRAGDGRSLDQLRADTFLDLLEGVGAAAAGVATDARPHSTGGVDLRVPLTTLMGLTDLPGELSGWGPVVAETARQIASRSRKSAWRISVYDRNGRLIHNGPVRRRPKIRDAAFVRSRDQTCRAPGCRVPASHADLDHVRRYVDGGPTTPDNLAVLCRHDHRLKDEGGWRLRQLQPGVFVWHSRLGHQYVVPPEPSAPPG